MRAEPVEVTAGRPATDTARLGRLHVSRVGLGCNNFGQRCTQEETTAVVEAALDVGITLFDTADIYGDTRSEQFLGQSLAGRRDDVVIGTKFGMRWGSLPGGTRPEDVRSALTASLRRLGTDRIDLYQLHFPGPPMLPEPARMDDVLGTLQDLVAEGLVVEIGCANFSADQLRSWAPAGTSGGFASVQNEYSLLRRDVESDVLPACADLCIGFLPYYPLASGLLTGKYRRGVQAPADTRLAAGWTAWANRIDDELLDRIERLDAFARERDHTLLELAMSWLLAQPGVTAVTVGATRPDQVRANVAATGWQLTAEELGLAAEISRPGEGR